MIAWMRSSGASGSRFTTCRPRAVRSFWGISHALSRNTRPWLEKNRMNECAVVWMISDTMSSSRTLVPCTPRPPRPWVRNVPAGMVLM